MHLGGERLWSTAKGCSQRAPGIVASAPIAERAPAATFDAEMQKGAAFALHETASLGARRLEWLLTRAGHQFDPALRSEDDRRSGRAFLRRRFWRCI